ncbi:hypothetical protein A1Q1_06207 [Trichosporon asahii var. asahii CBS 2479]|uniref:Uncharacterized protein n=1 Tax=Trichosporon asahii var. asahii (strain ATCC 90039 / CBS 2479 / JCM 2466 / KCTC 7840 / NBRC 103889/ NCYC 2677 / UAMH 7654) TaxID=1186058 RepID=J4U5M0_TRIAS|nr:hypothetical protein A1Q1_06207 [Trichosporon asahii var. asahii CBS 2479]EJT45310.1 hypothetical protein A1Q1_06207 [Trichosporon asahii var. asahii CBS 2479]
MRLLAVYQPLVVVAESREICDRLLLAAPLMGNLPEVGQWPSEVELGSVVDATLPFGGLPWSRCQGRPFLARCGPNAYTILVPVGDGGRVKYDPVVESEVIRVLVLANKAALMAVSVAMRFTHERGRPDPGNLARWQELLELIKNELVVTGIQGELEAAQEELRVLGGWILSRRQGSAHRRKIADAGQEDVDRVANAQVELDFDDYDTGDKDHLDVEESEAGVEEPVQPKLRTGTVVKYEGPKGGSPRRKEQFEHFSSWLDDLRARGIDERLFPNALCPPWMDREEWRRDFMESNSGVPIRRSVAHRSRGTSRRSTTDRAKAGKLTMASAIASASDASSSAASTALALPSSARSASAARSASSARSVSEAACTCTRCEKGYAVMLALERTARC